MMRQLRLAAAVVLVALPMTAGILFLRRTALIHSLALSLPQILAIAVSAAAAPLLWERVWSPARKHPNLQLRSRRDLVFRVKGHPVTLLQIIQGLSGLNCIMILLGFALLRLPQEAPWTTIFIPAFHIDADLPAALGAPSGGGNFQDTEPRTAPGDLDLSGRDLQYADLRMLRLSGANLRGANLRGANLYGADLSGVRTIEEPGADVSCSDAPAEWAHAVNLSGANLDHAVLAGADLRCASMQKAILTSANLEGALLVEADLTEASLKNASLSGAMIEHAIVDSVNLDGATLAGTSFRSSRVRGSFIRKASAAASDWCEADLSWSRFDGSDLRSSLFAGTIFYDTAFDGADLRGSLAFASRSAKDPDKIQREGTGGKRSLRILSSPEERRVVACKNPFINDSLMRDLPEIAKSSPDYDDAQSTQEAVKHFIHIECPDAARDIPLEGSTESDKPDGSAEPDAPANPPQSP